MFNIIINQILSLGVMCWESWRYMPRTWIGRFHIITLHKSHQTLFCYKWNINMCKKYYIWKIYTVFTALHVMQTRYSDENSVCPSVCLSVCHTRDPWQNGRKICPGFYTIWKNIHPSLLRRRMVGRGRPLLPEILGQPTPIWAKSPIFNQ